MKFYAVKKGRCEPQIFKDWKSCQEMVHEYPGAKFKSFENEKEAQDYLDGLPPSVSKPVSTKRKFESALPIEKEEICFKKLKSSLVVYTDGACPFNGKNVQKGGIGVYFGKNDPRNISQCIYAEPMTNNFAELSAIQKAIEHFMNQSEYYEMIIYTDSLYCINCLVHWRKGWKQRGWKKTDGKDILNLNILKKLDEMLESSFKSSTVDECVHFRHVHGHCGIEGNEQADQLATKACTNNS